MELEAIKIWNLHVREEAYDPYAGTTIPHGTPDTLLADYDRPEYEHDQPPQPFRAFLGCFYGF